MEVKMREPLDFPGAARFLELYEAGVSFNDMAVDPELTRDMFPDVKNERTRSWKFYYKEKELVNTGALKKRSRKGSQKTVSTATAKTLTESSSLEQINHYEEYLNKYEELIGAKAKRTEQGRKRRSLRQEWVVMSDLHSPDERMDLIIHAAERHPGAGCIIAGDLDDNEMMSRFDHTDWTAPGFRQALSHRDAMLDFITQHFPTTKILLGNHDLRLPRRAAKALGPDYAWISQQFLLWSYEQRHGIQVVTHDVNRRNGRPIPYLHYYDQVGDCMIGHVEVAGRPVGSGAAKAHDFFQSWQKELGLGDFRVVLQAHTHKQSFFRHPSTGVFCYEIGALCDIPSYSLTSRQSYAPPQLGYFHLVQYDGVTDINESRLVSLE
jgi:hypothetical protein